MLTIAFGVMLGVVGAFLLLLSPGLVFRLGGPVLGVLLVASGHSVVGGLLLVWLALFWSAYFVTALHMRWRQRKRA
jgi:hypothetical protein